MLNDIGYGIIGSGIMGRTYAEALRMQVHGGRLVAVAAGTRAPQLAADYAVSLESSVDSLLARSDVDAVIIATPHSTHLPLALAAAGAGKHVYLEKPMALTVAECDEIIRACQVNRRKLTVAAQMRYSDVTQRVKTELDMASIGEVRMFRVLSATVGWDVPDNKWISDPKEGGAYLDWGVHACDSLRWYSGSEATMAFARFRNFGGLPADDPTAMVDYEFASGAMCQILMSYEFPPPGLGLNYQFLIVGSDGYLDFDRDKLVIGKGSAWHTEMELPGWDWTILSERVNPRRISLTARQVQEFTDEIGGGPPTSVSGEDGRAALEMVEAAKLSALTNSVVTLPLTPVGRSSANA
jgi:predicted dehydrogenase